MNIFKRPFFNYLLRTNAMVWNAIDHWLRRKWLNRIRVSGKVKLRIEDVEFQMFSKWDDGIVDAIYLKNKE